MSGSPSPPSDGRARVLFVCLGNICRSPTAEAVMRHHVMANGLDAVVEVDSAGTAGWHTGDRPDDRARAEAARRGIEMRGAARRVNGGDFEYFDLILAMDHANLADLRALAPTSPHGDKAQLLREFDPSSNGDLEVPDPYYGGPNGFAEVFDLVDASCRGLLDHLRSVYL